MILRAAPAVVVSLALHALGFSFFAAREPQVVIQGGAPARAARRGNSFADMAAGVSTPVRRDQPVEEPEADVTGPPEPDRVVPRRQMVGVAARQTAVTIPRPVSETAAAVPEKEGSRPGPRATTGIAIAAPSPPAQVDLSVARAPAEAQPARSVAPAAEPVVEHVQPVDVARQTVETGTPVEVRQADAGTPRPRTRPERRDEARQAASRQSQRGAENAARGSTDGQRNAPASSASRNRAAAAEGTSAEASNYPGRVWAKLSRARRPRGLGRGAATVGFRIGADGALTGAGIIASSGNPRIDRAALLHVRRQAPFPRPPRGARTRFSFTFESEG